MEIAEEDEEEQQPTKRQSLLRDGNNDGDEKEARKSDVEPTEPTEPVKLDADLATSPENSKFSAASTSEVPKFVGAEEPSTADSSRRLSSQSGRDIYTSYSSFSAYSKPKVKIGPRPSLDTNPRPQTAGNFRPVSSIPAGFKLFGKGSNNKKSSSPSSSRKDSVGSLGSPMSEIQEMSFATAVPIPEEPRSKDNLSVPRPATSSGVSIQSTTTMTSKKAMTPEKARLKKAMQLREKKRKLAAKTSATPPVQSIETHQDDSIAEDERTSADAERMPIIDSGIAIESPPKDDQASEVTQPDSRPTSPVIASSEPDQSTKASSISESTEQTVQKDGVDETGAGSANIVITPPDESIPLAAVDDLEREKAPDNVLEASPKALLTDDNHVAETELPSILDPQERDSNLMAERQIEDVNEAPSRPSCDGKDGASMESWKTPTDIPASSGSHTQEAPNHDKSETARVPTGEPAEKPNPIKENTETRESSQIASTDTSPSDPSLPTNPSLSQSQEAPTVEVAEPVVDEDSDTDTIPARPSIEPATKRRLFNIDPIRVDLANRSRPTSQSEINFSDSESLLEELQSATVQEAKSMIVSKTPVTPVFPGRIPTMTSPVPGQNMTVKPHMVRTVSNPVRGSFVGPPTDVSQSSARSVSQGAAYLHKITQQRNGDNGLAAAKKTNVGSSISQRIKALELLSVHSAETASQPGSRPSSTFFSVKKDRGPSRSPSVVDRANSLSRDTRPSTAQSRGDSPETSRFRDRSGSISSRLSMFEPADSPGYQPRGRPETISVTARIIRDSPSTSQNPTDRSPLEFRQSPLQVDHQRADGLDTAAGGSIDQPSQDRPHSHSREPSKDSVSRRSSFTVVKDYIKERRKSVTSPSTDSLVPPTSSSGSRSPGSPPPSHQNMSIASRLSIGSRRSLSRDRASIPPSTFTEGSGSGDETKSNSDKKKSRTSRLMRRLSSLSGSNRNKTASPTIGTPTVTEEEWPEPASAAMDVNATTVAVDMGDVNVQFPDTLLWKRRNMYLDSQGFVVLSAAAHQQPAKTAGIKRYHLSEFKTPYAPDVEVQELPNSVVLDLLEGSAVQVACESRSGQMEVLQSE
jgi:hypothetical protein